MNRQTLSDEQMISEATLRSPEVFAQMAQQYYGRVYFTALAIVRQGDIAEDIAQETFLRAWLKRDTVKEPALLLQPWLVRIATNLALQWLRTGQQRSRLLPLIPMEEVTVEPVDDANPDPRQIAHTAEQRNQVAEAVMALPTELRQVVLLHYAEGLSVRDIARMNTEAPSTVTRRLEKARAQLRQHFESGLATGLALLKPRRRSAEKIFTLITTAAVIPAATRAQLLQLASDTPPPPMIDAVTSAAQAATLQEAGIMKTIIAKIGAAKLIAGAAAVAAVGGGAYGVKSLLTGSPNSTNRSALRAPVNRASFQNTDVSSLRAGRNKNNLTNRQPNQSARNNGGDPSVQRLKPSDRIALLRNDHISTNPVITTEPGETTGTVHFDLAVVNESGLPVAGSTVTVPEFGFETGAYFNTISLAAADVKSFLTNVNGIARVAVPSGPSMSGTQSQLFRTSRITAVATHPDYAPTRQVIDFTSVTKLVLTSGNILEVLPLDGATSAPIIGKIEAEFKSPFAPDQYTRPDGTVVFRKIAEDNAEFILKYTNDKGKLFVSDKQSIPLPASNASPLPVSLYPTFTVIGRLDDTISPPVTDVDVHTLWLTPVKMERNETTVPVTAEGTFVINNIPKGTRLSVAALGNGYCAVTSQDDNDDAFPYQITVDQDNQQLTLPMEKTADVTLHVVGPDNTPVAGATISASVSVMNMGDYPRYGGSYRAVTDDRGRATILNIPPLKNVRFQMQHPEFRLPMRESKLRIPAGKSGITKNFGFDVELDLSSGGEFQHTVQAEVKPPDPPATGNNFFVVPDGAKITYTMPPPNKIK